MQLRHPIRALWMLVQQWLHLHLAASQHVDCLVTAVAVAVQALRIYIMR